MPTVLIKSYIKLSKFRLETFEKDTVAMEVIRARNTPRVTCRGLFSPVGLYRKLSNISRTKSPNLSATRLVS